MSTKYIHVFSYGYCMSVFWLKKPFSQNLVSFLLSCKGGGIFFRKSSKKLEKLVFPDLFEVGPF